MPAVEPQTSDPRSWRRLAPRAGTQVQLVAAATTWLVGLGFLLVRGVLLIEEPAGVLRWNAAIVPVAALAVVLGVVKARLVLVKYAHRAVDRITGRGRSCFFGFFSWTSWAFIAVMMGGGTLLRHSALVDSAAGRDVLAVVYIAVGTALLIADRVLWAAALGTAAATRSASGRLLAGAPAAPAVASPLEEPT
jgi:hypothetical protein